MALRDTGASRRRFLRTGMGALLVGLAGCGGDESDTPGPTSEASTDTASDAPTGTATGRETSTETPTRTETSTGRPTPTQTGTPTATSPGTATQTGTPTPREPEFVPLFDGSSLSGWHRVFGNGEYAVRDGDGSEEPYIEGVADSGTSTSFLSTYQVFDDFVLELELWIDPDGLNSGIMLRCNTTQDRQKLHGPQVEAELSGDAAQLQPGGESGYVYGTDLGTGWMSDGQPHDAFDNGAWNGFRMRVEDERLRTWVNDEPIEDLDLGGYDLLPMGVIALQIHGGSSERRAVRFRNVRIKELDVREWTRPFSGRDTGAWTNPLNRGDVTVSEGVLELSGDRPFFILGEDAFGDFVFETWVKGDTGGGVLVRNPGESRLAGYRVEIDPSENTLSGSLYDEGNDRWLENIDGASHAQFAFKPGEWNYYRVMADGDSLRVWVNGITTAEVTDGSQSSGRIGLMHRGGEGTIRFRDAGIKPLGDDGGAN